MTLQQNVRKKVIEEAPPTCGDSMKKLTVETSECEQIVDGAAAEVK